MQMREDQAFGFCNQSANH